MIKSGKSVLLTSTHKLRKEAEMKTKFLRFPVWAYIIAVVAIGVAITISFVSIANSSHNKNDGHKPILGHCKVTSHSDGMKSVVCVN